MSPAEAARRLGIDVRGIVLEINGRLCSRAVRGVNIMRNAAIEVLSQNGTGRTYKRGKRGVHVASAPGQPPAPDTGNLRRNWRRQTYAHPNGKGLGVSVHMRITSDMFYQKFLEFGTRKMAPRPHQERIRTKARPKVAALFADI